MSIGALLAFLYIAWQVISFIMGAAEKKKEIEKQQGIAARRDLVREETVELTRERSAPTSPKIESPKPTFSEQLRTRTEELAARRQAQLEELRRRRGQAQGQTAPSPGQVRVGRGSAASGPRVAAGSGMAPPSQQVEGVGIEAWRRKQAADEQHQDEMRQRAQAEKAQSEKQAHLEVQKDILRKAQQASARKARSTEQPPKAVAKSREEIAYQLDTQSAASVRLVNIRNRMKNRQTLREMFIMKELFDPPVSLRQPEA